MRLAVISKPASKSATPPQMKESRDKNMASGPPSKQTPPQNAAKKPKTTRKKRDREKGKKKVKKQRAAEEKKTLPENKKIFINKLQSIKPAIAI